MVTVRVVSRPAAGRRPRTHRVCQLVHDLSNAAHQFLCRARRVRAHDRDVTGFMRHVGAPSHGSGTTERDRTVSPRDAFAATRDFGKSMCLVSAPTRVSGNGLHTLTEAVWPSPAGSCVRSERSTGVHVDPRARSRSERTNRCRSRRLGAAFAGTAPAHADSPRTSVCSPPTPGALPAPRAASWCWDWNR